MLRRLMHFVMLAGMLGLTPSLAAQSLFNAETLADGTLYSDQVARRIGDLITVRVVERTSVSETNETTTERTNDASFSVNLIPNSDRLPASVGTSSQGTLPGMNLSSEKSFEGDGEFQHTGSLEANLTGRVIDVLDNGNLVIVARRQLAFGPEETKTIILTGICRTADINSENIIVSERLHNFQVAIEGEGPLSRAQQEGLIGRLLDVIWPF